MKAFRYSRIAILVFVLSAIARTASAVLVLPLSAIQPGTEVVTFVPNGDFEAGPIPSDAFPPDWNRINDGFVFGGVNDYPSNGALAATAHVDSTGNSAGGYGMAAPAALLSDTNYVLSGYLWNFGGLANPTLNANIDLNDAPGEPFFTLTTVTPGAEQGWYFSALFNTAVTGTNVTARTFFDGDLTSVTSFFNPRGFQGDNLAITLASEYQDPLLIPEPGSLTLMAGACCAFIVSQRRSRKRRPAA